VTGRGMSEVGRRKPARVNREMAQTLKGAVNTGVVTADRAKMTEDAGGSR
jgi:hypothetical protein